MTGAVNGLSTILVGQGAVPADPNVMGPVQPTAGIFGSGGDVWGAINNVNTFASIGLQMAEGRQTADAELAQSRQAARALEFSAQESLFQAGQEEIKGKQDANNVMRQMLQTIASQRLAFATNGIDPGFGTPVGVADNTRRFTDIQMGITRDDALIRSLSRRRQAYANIEEAGNVRSGGKQRAQAARMNSLVKAGGTVADKFMRSRERG